MESNHIFVILDTFVINIFGNLETRIFGVFTDTDIDTVRQHIENLNLKNFRWVGDTRFKFSTDKHAHVGEIISIRKNEILQHRIEGNL